MSTCKSFLAAKYAGVIVDGSGRLDDLAGACASVGHIVRVGVVATGIVTENPVFGWYRFGR
ncbi:MAG: hypothetical protein ACREPR_09320 [Brasilonema sp.]